VTDERYSLSLYTQGARAVLRHLEQVFALTFVAIDNDSGWAYTAVRLVANGNGIERI
jgi:hypothetical protein